MAAKKLGRVKILVSLDPIIIQGVHAAVEKLRDNDPKLNASTLIGKILEAWLKYFPKESKQ